MKKTCSEGAKDAGDRMPYNNVRVSEFGNESVPPEVSEVHQTINLIQDKTAELAHCLLWSVQTHSKRTLIFIVVLLRIAHFIFPFCFKDIYRVISRYMQIRFLINLLIHNGKARFF